MAWTRWWFGFDQTSHHAWLQRLFGAQLRWLGVTVVVSGIAVMAAIAHQPPVLFLAGTVAASPGPSGSGAPAKRKLFAPLSASREDEDRFGPLFQAMAVQ